MENVSQINTTALALASKKTSKGDVVSAIKSASEKSGVNFSYLLTKAAQESSLDPNAKARGSSATGLYQFIDQTWLKTVKQSGAKYGLGAYADAITVGSDGVARVGNEAMKKEILALRKDATVSSEMAAELDKSNQDQLETQVGGKVGATELYLAHFLGAGGAASLLNTMKTNPDATAANILPTAAAANKSVFYDKNTGAAKSVSQIYQQFAAKFDAGSMKTMVASAESSAASAASNSAATGAVAQQQAQAKQVELAVASSIMGASSSAIASGVTSGALAGNTVALANGVSLDKTTASPFAAMVLAQMDMDTFGSRAAEIAQKGDQSDDERRKSVLSSLAQAA